MSSSRRVAQKDSPQGIWLGTACGIVTPPQLTSPLFHKWARDGGAAGWRHAGSHAEGATGCVRRSSPEAYIPRLALVPGRRLCPQSASRNKPSSSSSVSRETRSESSSSLTWLGFSMPRIAQARAWLSRYARASESISPWPSARSVVASFLHRSGFHGDPPGARLCTTETLAQGHGRRCVQLARICGTRGRRRASSRCNSKPDERAFGPGKRARTGLLIPLGGTTIGTSSTSSKGTETQP